MGAGNKYLKLSNSVIFGLGVALVLLVIISEDWRESNKQNYWTKPMLGSVTFMIQLYFSFSFFLAELPFDVSFPFWPLSFIYITFSLCLLPHFFCLYVSLLFSAFSRFSAMISCFSNLFFFSKSHLHKETSFLYLLVFNKFIYPSARSSPSLVLLPSLNKCP